MPIRVRRTGSFPRQLTTRAFMRSIGAGLIARLTQRTRKGIAADGSTFRPLSPRYAAQKRKALGHARADLQVSGRMLNEILVKPSRRNVRVTFSSAGGATASGGTFIQRSRSVGAADKAFWHNVSGAGRARTRRVWFDLNRKDEQWVVGEVRRHLRQALGLR